MDGKRLPNGVTCRQIWMSHLPTRNDRFFSERTDHLALCEVVLNVNGISPDDYDTTALSVEVWYSCAAKDDYRIQWLYGAWQEGVSRDLGFTEHLRCIIPVGMYRNNA